MQQLVKAGLAPSALMWATQMLLGLLHILQCL
jgi:hypothetical protein